MTDTSRGLAIADSTKLRTGRGIHHDRWKTLASKERLVLPHFNFATRLQKENCKGIDDFNRGEIKTKLLSWANWGTTKCTLSDNEKPFSHDVERISLEDVGGL
jgi:hypothetical protein